MDAKTAAETVAQARLTRELNNIKYRDDQLIVDFTTWCKVNQNGTRCRPSNSQSTPDGVFTNDERLVLYIGGCSKNGVGELLKSVAMFGYTIQHHGKYLVIYAPPVEQCDPFAGLGGEYDDEPEPPKLTTTDLTKSSSSRVNPSKVFGGIESRLNELTLLVREPGITADALDKKVRELRGEIDQLRLDAFEKIADHDKAIVTLQENVKMLMQS